jgi:hypothetical protein
MAFTTITITGSFTRPDGQPAQGTVTATLSEQLENGTAIIEPTPIAGVLNAAGQLKDSSGLQPFTVVANDDPATTPQGSEYQFVLELDSAPVKEFSAVVSHSAVGGTVDLSALDPS